MSEMNVDRLAKVRLRSGGELEVERFPGVLRCRYHNATYWGLDGKWDETQPPGHPLDIVEVLELIKPVVIDGPGEYWCVNGSIACVRQAVPSDYQQGYQWRGAYKRPDQGYNAYRADGTTSGDYEPYRIVAKVEYRERPLTPGEAFNLLGKIATRRMAFGGEWPINYVGRDGVHLGKMGVVFYKTLADGYRLIDGTPLTVKEPVPFGEAASA